MGNARRPFVAGNWKMHKTVAEATALARELRGMVSMVHGVRIGVAPPYTAIHAVAKALEGSNVDVGGQNVHFEKQGAFTGEISVGMLEEAGCSFAIIGHSERRQLFGETDELVRQRTAAALAGKLTPVVCVGETLGEREAGRTIQVVAGQVKGGLSTFSREQLSRIALAYEPVWAIGTGKTATTLQAQEVHAELRKLLRELCGDVADTMPILYGGSVKPDNAAELLAQPDVDGALVGGASLTADSFAKIAKAAKV